MVDIEEGPPQLKNRLINPYLKVLCWRHILKLLHELY